ncbi:hypothetical protein MBLNU457_3737t2 [Dothideomycetes sp. NU457]
MPGASRRRFGPPVDKPAIPAHLNLTSAISLEHWFNHIGSSDLSYGQEPPRKRARLDSTQDSIIADSIPVARISIALRSEPSFDVFKNENDQEHFEKAREVGLLSVDQPEGQCATFVLASSRLRHRSETHHQVASSAILTGQELEDIQRVVEIERRSRGTGKSYVAQSRCSLRCARNDNTEAREFFLEAAILWPDGASALTLKEPSSRPEIGIFARYYGIDFPSRASSWDTKVFYDSVHAPAIDEPISPALDRKVLETELYPFQKRAVGWMLRREKAPIILDPSKQSSLVQPKIEEDVDHDTDSDATLPFSYTMARDAEGRECLISKSQATIARRAATEYLAEPKGGILAEEMGLGKTVELISLICLNQRPSDARHLELKSTGATLIVTPPTILQQWMDELGKHAPSLSWMHYQGTSSQGRTKQTEEELMESFATKDIVITTYPVLAKEIHFAVDPPDRNLRRREAPPARKRSPLVQMHWWRVCLDEAQMVESGVSAAAKVVALIPRESAWAVSGTPLKNDVQDLRGLLVFLRYRPFSDNQESWKRLVYYHRDEFERLFNSIALRHTKDKIRHELKLPPQRRITITVPFTAVEEQNYKSLFAEMAYDCGCALDGSPLHDQWNPEDPRTAERMRSWLLRLRQSCLHPQIGGRNRQALGRAGGPLRTVGEVLEVMIDQTETAIRVDSRQSLLARMQRAHVIGNAKDDERRAEKALNILKESLLLADARVDESRRELAQFVGPPEDADGDDSPEVVARQRVQANLRGALELQHACDFYVGTAYYQIKTNPILTEEESEEFKRLEEKEIFHYERARVTRKELLKESTAKVENLISALQERKVDPSLTSTASLTSLQAHGGIESRRVLTKVEELADVMSEQTNLLVEWRTKIIELLCKPLVDKEDEATGEEYEESTKQQDEMYCYVDAFRAMVADRSTCLSGQINILINHEMGLLYKEAKDEKGHSPTLMIELLQKRNALLQREDGMISLRGLLHEARSAETAVQWRGSNSAHVEAELTLIRKLITTLQAVLTAQTKGLSQFEKDQELFRAAMNQRLEFYRQLQQISDSVVPYKEELDETLDVAALAEATNKLNALEKGLATLRTKLRFLQHLRDESTDEAQKICVICQCPFEQGMLTHRTCPVCKRNLSKTDFHAVSYKPRELQAQQEEVRSEASSAEDGLGPAGEQSTADERNDPAGRISIYNDVSPAVLNEIKSIDLPHRSSYGTKIDTISRHLIYLRNSEPGTKTVIFSQYRDFLSVLSSAFKAMGISHVQIQQANSITRFREDASIEAFLLDAKTDSSGLNLVNATHVMLCEPLINAAIELQAIARVHRIGQRRPTSVWMYLVKDTVEESIYELSVKRRLEHVQQSSSTRSKRETTTTTTTSRSVTPAPGLGTEAAVEAANSLELQQAPLGKLLVQGKGQGEVVAKDDLWKCLFGQASKSAASNSGPDRGLLDAPANDYALNDSGGAVGAEVGRFLRAEAAENRAVL